MDRLGKLCRRLLTSVVCFSLLIFSHFSGRAESFGVAGGVGINYGQIADDLPKPEQVREMLLASNLTSVRLYDADPAVLQAFRGTGIEVVVNIGNEYVDKMGTRATKALQWVRKNVQAYLPDTNITGILVGNEIFSTKTTAAADVPGALLGALKNVHAALVQLGLDSQVRVSTAHSFDIFAGSFPPSSCTFKEAVMPQMRQLLSFLSAAKAPFLVNAYPYFAYKSDPANVPLDYVLFRSTSATVTDAHSGLHYDNMLYAQIDAANAAVAAAGYGESVPVMVSETGWPSHGDANEPGATLENARDYNGNLLARLRRGQGTPAHPDRPVKAYIFALFNENMKPGPSSERNYGLFKPDGSQVYNVGLKGLKQAASTSPSSSAASSSPDSSSSSASPGVAGVSTAPFSYSYSYTSAARQVDVCLCNFSGLVCSFCKCLAYLVFSSGIQLPGFVSSLNVFSVFLILALNLFSKCLGAFSIMFSAFYSISSFRLFSKRFDVSNLDSNKLAL